MYHSDKHETEQTRRLEASGMTPEQLAVHIYGPEEAPVILNGLRQVIDHLYHRPRERDEELHHKLANAYIEKGAYRG